MDNKPGIQLDATLTEEQKRVAELVGFETYQSLIEVYGGSYIYIPKPDKFDRVARNEKITSEFDGYNFHELAIKYGLTDVTIRGIVKEQVRAIRTRPIDGQTSLF